MRKYKPKKNDTKHILHDIISSKKQSIENRQSKLENIRKKISTLNSEWEKCIGPYNILKAKKIHIKIQEYNNEIDLLSSSSVQQSKVFKLMEQNDTLETTHNKFKSSNVSSKLHYQISSSGRLYPPLSNNRKNIFDRMSVPRIQKWQGLRAKQKRQAIMNGESLPVKNYNIDFCEKCKVDRIVRRESARSTCPKCADSKTFAAHVLDVKDNDREKTNKGKQDNCLKWMERSSVQYGRGYPMTSDTTLEKICIEYTRVHNHDPYKVSKVATTKIFTKLKDSNLPKETKDAPERVSRELKSQSIPEYTPEQINYLLNQRNRLKPNPQNNDDKSSKKSSFTNIIFLRNFGLAGNMENSRLFQPAKTNKIHLERCRNLEQKCKEQKAISGDMEWSWELKPFS